MARSDNPGHYGTVGTNDSGFSPLASVGNPTEYPSLSLLDAQRASTGAAALAVPATPAAPTAASAGATSCTVTFTAPASVSPITLYTVVSTPGSITKTGTASPLVVTGLTTATPYTFKVTATNIVGDSTQSAASNSATPT